MSNVQKRHAKLLETVSPRLDLPTAEESVLAFWLKHKVFEQSVSQREGNEQFVFFEGPPTANGKPGLHHVLARSFKDAIPRFQTMRGKFARRRAGWDTHGLPVELEVEKQLGISGKQEIESLVPDDVSASIAKFNQLCRESVWKYKDEWEQLTRRIGFWIDMDDPYVTYENQYIESVWWVLRTLWDKDLLYQDFKVVPYCPRCGTSLSSHEVAQGYAETTDTAVYVKFAVKDEPKTFLIAWTTTPWTLPGNVALAVGNDIQYSRYFDQETGETYIVADALAGRVLAGRKTKKKPIKFDELLEMSYQPLFDVEPLQSDTSHRVYEAEFVTIDDGSGIVHTAVMYGEDDFALGSEIGLPKHHTVNERGEFTDDVPELAGQFVKDIETEQRIVAMLDEQGLLLSTDSYTHTYPFCWRCKTPLLYYAQSSWFVRMSQLRDQLLARNTHINWIPSHLRDGRFGEWLRDVKDWALSRQRYWGTPLPIWECDHCNHMVCVANTNELKQLAGDVPDDLHRPYIDKVRWHCQSCNKGSMQRFTEVIDVWFDSGSMPLAQWHYPADTARATEINDNKSYPADYIAEGVDQTRGWFYTLLAIATALDRIDESPYRNVISHGLVLDEHGKKMSKSVGNIIAPEEAIDEFGVDTIRYYFYSVNGPGDDKLYDPAELTQVMRKVFMILWNTYSFLATRAARDTWKPKVISTPENVLDIWLISRTNRLIADVTNYLEAFDLFRASREIGDYITELSTWYLRLSRKRDDEQFLPTLYWALRTVTMLMAPLTPFIAELLWQRLRTDNEALSVHLLDWPDVGVIDRQSLDHMHIVQALVEAGRAERASAGIKLRQPLRTATVTGAALDADHQGLLAQELNVHTVDMHEGERGITLDTELDDSLRAEGFARDLVRGIQQLRKQAKRQLGEHVNISIDGSHELLAAVMEYDEMIAAQTQTTIHWEAGEGEHQLELQGLVLTLLE